MHYKFISFLFASLLTLSAYGAKNSGAVYGKIIEKESNTALSYATISIHDTSNKVLSGTMSDQNGQFKLNNLNNGDYKVKISFIGFKDTTLNIVIDESAPIHNLGTIFLSSDAVKLNSAVVVAKVPVIEQKLDKIIMNVSEAVSTQGSNALDILRKAPGVSIDPSGNILLNGSSVQIWIDGRASNLTGPELEALLSGTDGSTIDKIEIIAHPSSKYDASGAGGIINIRTKKNFAKGISGSLRSGFNLASYDKLYYGADGTFNLNYRAEKNSTSFTYSPRYNQNFERVSSYTNMGSGLTLDGYTDLRFNNPVHSIRLSHDYFIDKSNIFGFIINAMTSRSEINSGEKTENNLYNSGSLIEKSKSGIYGEDEFDYINSNINYTKIFKNSQEVTLNFDYGYYDVSKYSSQENYFYNPAGEQTKEPNIFNSNSLQYINIISFKADYEQTIFKKIKMESGIKWARSVTDNNLTRVDLFDNQWVNNNQLSSQFKYHEDISALYISGATQINPKVSLKAGLRGEVTQSSGEWISADTTTSKNYVNLFPTLFAGYNPNKDIRWGLSYSVRVRRPSFRQLNPFRMYIDANSAIEGNPDLKPQFSNQISLSLGIKQHFNISLSGQYTKDAIIQSPFFNMESGEKIIKMDNFGKQNFTGFSVSVTELPIKKWLTINSNIFLAYLSNSSGDYKSESLFANGFLSTNLILPKNIKIELTGSYQSGAPYGYFKIRPMGDITLGFKRTFMDNRANISVTIHDILGTQKNRAEIINDNVKTYSFASESKSQRVAVSFSYRFGQSKAVKQRKVGNLEEGSRVGTSN
jgi:outer membrane receptor protein involved in Fe transport